jgi:hypothetical protein
LPLIFGNTRMEVGDVDSAGRMLVVVAKEYLFKRSKQVDPVAVCVTPGCTQGPDETPWRREGKNAMGTGSRHAAAWGHKVVVTREMVTEYDGSLPRELGVAQ